MTSESHEAWILRDEAGDYYAIPADVLARYRVPAEHAPTVEQAVATAAGDTIGFGHGQGQGHGQGHGQGQGQGLGRGQGQGQGRGLTSISPNLVLLPFPSISDGTSNTITFGEGSVR